MAKANEAEMGDITITSGGKERVAAASSLYSKAFEIDPVITYLLSPMGSKSARLAYLPSYFKALLTAASMNEALFFEANDFKSVSVLMPPGCRVDNPWTLIPAGFLGMLWSVGIRSCWRMLLEFTPLTDASKSKGLSPHTKYYYVFFTATSTAHRSQGLCSTVIRHIQEISSRDNIPLWLEATTARSMRIYEKLGFETVDEMVLGKGKADQDGNACKGGDGVKIWGMVWWPKGLKEKAMLTRK